ncbi:UDP-sugar pyrophosphorylase isoform X12 [Physcomitrium patens]|uniref:UDP-sugar pyrophosphorylase isoform X12 n=1 Tax=Physcomitrium patens TaxID=3218 RepID=UPI000D15FDD8|nr:UDP-sugar pyrophosphorylase-like isoform X6 [Physcomitrium patens]|eukprot:XP_024380032.1 UDP-sugar pyrophosphorylase-like isoform X6 [Physcomitrella patens]
MLTEDERGSIEESHLNSTPGPTPRRRTTLNRRSVRTLLREGQSHLFEHWPPPGEHDDDKRRFSEQVEKFSERYPGGLAAYVRRAKTLQEYVGSNQRHKEFEGCTPSIAEGVILKYGSRKYVEYEEAGLKEFARVAFVLVAGGSAERLNRGNEIKENTAPCLNRKTANLLLSSNDPYLIKTMPGGSGEVHAILFSSGLLQTWKKEGRNWVVIFEEGNGLTFKATPALLGASMLCDFDVNLLASARKGESPGAGIVQFSNKSGSRMVANIDCIHQVLSSMGHRHMDLNDFTTAHSPFPTGLDQMVLKPGPYLDELTNTQGRDMPTVLPLLEEGGYDVMLEAQ